MSKTVPFTLLLLLFSIIKFHLIKCGTIINKSSDIFSAPAINDEPIIGVLSQEMTSYLRSKYADQYHSYIAASYVKFIEGGGARVVPVWIGKDRKYYEDLMSKLNGILFPGGAVSFTNRNGYAQAGNHIYKIATKMNNNGDYFPLWGTCLGFELITYLSANRTEIRADCSSHSQALPLEFKSSFKKSRMFKDAPDRVIKVLKDEAVTSNFHTFCLTEKNMTDYHLDSIWRVLSVNNDWNGLTFVSTIEHSQYPFYAVQFHPEKNIYEWVRNKNISHTSNAIIASQYFAEFFVNEARKSHHHFIDSKDEDQYMIYNYQAEFSGAKGAGFEQTYLFPEEVNYMIRRKNLKGN
ncbi:hypothetical protein ACKWTF_004267 [Chironomus riparius]